MVWSLDECEVKTGRPREGREAGRASSMRIAAGRCGLSWMLAIVLGPWMLRETSKRVDTARTGKGPRYIHTRLSQGGNIGLESGTRWGRSQHGRIAESRYGGDTRHH
ncbi:hypothetical protein K456DRAFT_1191893 [Colletotrichum gloeosporioides 23]|nr:hypothetical protein K456DRAFT_1191893 [Colletotrichum gloeosporioides 23]